MSLKIKSKQRKRAVTADDTRVSVIADEKKVKREVDESPFHFDDEEVEREDAQRHLEQFHEASGGVGEILERVRELKSVGGDDVAEEIAKLRVEGAIKFISLKKLNRVSHVRCKKMRDITAQGKEKMDSYHLQLQNLLYEAAHLQKEITKCLHFKSKDEDIQLVPIEDFIKDAPPEISKLDDDETDEHKLKLARLHWELEQRMRLSEKLKDIEKERDLVEGEIRTKRDQLDGLEPKLSQILETTKPVQEYLNLPFDKTREDHLKASYLPSPLYVLYMQTTAYHEACDKRLTVSIDGDIEVAKAFQDVIAEQEEESDSDQEEQDGEKKSSKRRRKTVEAKQTSVIDRVFRKHPLSISLDILCKDGSNMTLTFVYLVQLKVTTVNVTVKPAKGQHTESAFSSDLLSPESILFDLYPGDHGNSMPNPASHYELDKLQSHDLTTHLTSVGHPYMWVQWMCGVTFLPDSQPPDVKSVTSARNMQQTIRLLRQRLQARLCLLRQLVLLEQKTVVAEPAYQSLFPAKISSKLVSWTRSTFADFKALPHAAAYIDSGMATESYIYFTATADRKSAKLVCEVVIRPDYPVSPPLFVVSLDWKGKRTAASDFNILSMEAEVNIHWKDLVTTSRDQLLTNQLHRLLMCMDVYLETEAVIGGSESGEIPRNHIYPKVTRGPMRGKPYVYNSQLGYFSHRHSIHSPTSNAAE